MTALQIPSNVVRAVPVRFLTAPGEWEDDVAYVIPCPACRLCAECDGHGEVALGTDRMATCPVCQGDGGEGNSADPDCLACMGTGDREV